MDHGPGVRSFNSQGSDLRSPERQCLDCTKHKTNFFKWKHPVMVHYESQIEGNETKRLILARAGKSEVFGTLSRECHQEQTRETRSGVRLEHYTSYNVKEQDFFAATIEECWKETGIGPSDRYCRNLIKDYVSRVEKSGTPIESDTLMDLVMRTSLVKKLPPTPDEFCYLCFPLPPKGRPLLKIREYPYHNDVALRLWEAGATLGEFFLANKSWVQGKRVVELGAGVGLTGLVIAGCCGAHHVSITDYTAECRENMDHNIGINQEWLRYGGLPTLNIKESHLDWSSFSQESPGQPMDFSQYDSLLAADVLVAADVVYDVSGLTHLVAVVRKFLLCSTSSKYAIFAITRRNMATFATFLSLLDNEGIAYRWIASGTECAKLPKFFMCRFNQGRSDVQIALLAAGHAPECKTGLSAEDEG